MLTGTRDTSLRHMAQRVEQDNNPAAGSNPSRAYQNVQRCSVEPVSLKAFLFCTSGSGSKENQKCNEQQGDSVKQNSQGIPVEHRDYL